MFFGDLGLKVDIEDIILDIRFDPNTAIMV